MKVRRTGRFLNSYAAAPGSIQRIFDRKVDLLLKDLRHPSLRAKKYDEARGIWQARVNNNWRFYFTIEGDSYTLIDIMAHPK